MKSAVFTAMLPGELASSAGNYVYDGIQTANFMYNVVIINADIALNPSAKMRIIYTTIQKNTAIFQLRKFNN
jgi:disulfide oxidoreductase YuzD